MIMTQIPELVQQKLDAFESIQAEFEQCFRFKQDVHGQKRFPSFSIGQIVSYLHALWLCECKDRLLSVYRNIRRYEGDRCLELLRTWQAGRNADVVAFLLYKLDMHSFADFTAQIEEARYQQEDEASARHLEYGRMILLNRGMNLMHVLETISALSENDVLNEIRLACEQYGHLPAQIEAQLAETATPLYAYRPHALLAQRNMMLMNRLGVDVQVQIPEHVHAHAWNLRSPDEPLAPFAEQVINGYLELLAPVSNTMREVHFVDRAEPERE